LRAIRTAGSVGGARSNPRVYPTRACGLGEEEEDPLSGSLFVFVNRRGNYVKLVGWDRTGWCLFAKRLEHGRFRFPRAEAKQELSVQVFRLLLDGIALGPRHPQ